MFSFVEGCNLSKTPFSFSSGSWVQLQIHSLCLSVLRTPRPLQSIDLWISFSFASVLRLSKNWSKSVQRGLQQCRAELLLLPTEHKSYRASERATPTFWEREALIINRVGFEVATKKPRSSDCGQSTLCFKNIICMSEPP